MGERKGEGEENGEKKKRKEKKRGKKKEKKTEKKNLAKGLFLVFSQTKVQEQHHIEFLEKIFLSFLFIRIIMQ